MFGEHKFRCRYKQLRKILKILYSPFSVASTVKTFGDQGEKYNFLKKYFHYISADHHKKCCLFCSFRYVVCIENICSK